MSDSSEPINSQGASIPFWRTEQSKGRKKPIGKFGVDQGERGVYDTRNPLNDLTGKEWTFFLNSLLIKAYPPVADQCGFDLRKIHPCPKPPYLMRDIILFFTKAGQRVLDPFAGVGGTLLGASLCEAPREAVGIELNPDFADAYRAVEEASGLKAQEIICGDSLEVLDSSEFQPESFDLVLTDPPYGDLMTKQRTGHKSKLYGRTDATPFTQLPHDLGNMTDEEFYEALQRILEKSVKLLKPKKYLVVFCKDKQPSKDNTGLTHAAVIDSLISIPGLSYKGMRIWHDQAADLYPFGYPYAFVMNQMHQYILIFRKEP